ncbi:MAG: class I SAM-dependent methyltransferase [Myxococcales bacterium]
MDPVRPNSEVYAEHALGGAMLDTIESAVGYNRWIVDFFRPYLGAANVELGAGHGTLTEIVGADYRVRPFDVEPDNLRVLSKRFAGHPRVAACGSDILELREFDSLDCIYSSNVLEHIVDDATVVQHCARLLKPGGWFVALVPAGRWLYSDFDRALGHHRRYVAADLKRLEVTQGPARLLTRDCRYVNIPGAFGWFLQMRLLGHSAVGTGDVRKVELLLPVIRLLDRLRLPVGQSLVFAMQRT